MLFMPPDGILHRPKGKPLILFSGLLAKEALPILAAAVHHKLLTAKGALAMVIKIEIIPSIKLHIVIALYYKPSRRTALRRILKKELCYKQVLFDSFEAQDNAPSVHEIPRRPK
jgi:hypothetical protein